MQKYNLKKVEYNITYFTLKKNNFTTFFFNIRVNLLFIQFKVQTIIQDYVGFDVLISNRVMIDRSICKVSKVV